MDNEQFKKGIEDLKSIRLTDVEKARMLESIFATPIPSPYMKRIPVFAFVYSFILLITAGGITYASASSLPGDVLYTIKTGVVESVLDVVNRSPENRIVWEEEKVERRIVEAEVLAKQGRLDDKKLEGLGRSIEKSSIAFTKAVNTAASSTTTSTSSARERAEGQKKEFRRKINERQESKVESTRGNINRLKDTAIKVLDDEDRDDNEGDDEDNK